MNLSIVIPVYNTANYLERCIGSVLACSVPLDFSYEILLVDDGSNDNSPEICDWYEEVCALVKVIHKKNEGIVMARMAGCRLAEGKYISFIDSDDYVDRNYLGNICEALKTAADWYLFNNHRNPSGSKEFRIEKNMSAELLDDREKLNNYMLKCKSFAVWDKLYKGDFLKTICYKIQFSPDYHISYGEDILINFCYMRLATNAYCQDTASYYHVIDTKTSICRKATVRHLTDIDAFFVVGDNYIHDFQITNELAENFYYLCIRNYIRYLSALKKETVFNKCKKELVCSALCKRLNAIPLLRIKSKILKKSLLIQFRSANNA